MTSDEMLKSMNESPDVSIEYAIPDPGKQSLDASQVLDADGQQIVSDSHSDIGLIEDQNNQKLEEIVPEVVEYIKEIEKEYNRNIPVIAAGGIWDNKDIKRFLSLGASGVQMATRFVATNECDASEEFKNAYINAKKGDIKIINSPVGMPGRAIYNNFIKQTEKERSKISKCYNCIKTCDASSTPYCITKALINAVEGNMDNALVFCGSNVDKINEIVSVHNLIQELMQ